MFALSPVSFSFCCTAADCGSPSPPDPPNFDSSDSADLPAYHEIRDAVGVLLVCVSDLADSTLEVHPGPLLNDVGRFVGGGM